MRPIPLALTTLLLLTTPTLAPPDTRCRKDNFGNTICTDDLWCSPGFLDSSGG